MNSFFKSKNSTQKKSHLLLKLILAFVIVYIGIALVLHFIRIDNYNYSYKEANWFQLTSSILIQPASDLFLTRKTTYYYDWQKISLSDIDGSVLPITLRSNKDVLADYSKDISAKNLQRDIGYINEAAIIQPKNHSGTWSLVFCNIDKQICKKSNIVHSGKVKILVDGNIYLWGISGSGKYTQLELVKYIDIKEELATLFV